MERSERRAASKARQERRKLEAARKESERVLPEITYRELYPGGPIEKVERAPEVVQFKFTKNGQRKRGL